MLVSQGCLRGPLRRREKSTQSGHPLTPSERALLFRAARLPNEWALALPTPAYRRPLGIAIRRIAAKLIRFSKRGERALLHGPRVLAEIERTLAATLGRERFDALHDTRLALMPVLEARRAERVSKKTRPLSPRNPSRNAHEALSTKFLSRFRRGELSS